jgi:NDP-sugar pyrophosphorylase family protein
VHESEPAGVVLAAGAGTRLRPLTDFLPKALCPVANVALLDWALARLRPVAPDIAVNAHHRHQQIEQHLAGLAGLAGLPGRAGLADGSVHLSVEQPEALGTAGALGRLRGWIDGRSALVVNADAWSSAPLSVLVEGWDGERLRVLVVAAEPGGERADFSDERGSYRFAGASLLPWDVVVGLAPEPTGLYEVAWRPAEEAGRLELVVVAQPFFDCGTPAEYLDANLCASGGASVIGAGAMVEGEVVRSVVWPGGVVRRGERLVDCIRVGADATVGRDGGTSP